MRAQAGLGASVFYAAPINMIEGVPPYIASAGPYRNAARLAEGLFTLPTYREFDLDAARRVDQLIGKVMRR